MKMGESTTRGRGEGNPEEGSNTHEKRERTIYDTFPPAIHMYFLWFLMHVGFRSPFSVYLRVNRFPLKTCEKILRESNLHHYRK